MKFLLPLLFVVTFNLPAQSILGKWKTIDDKSGKEKSIVEIFERAGKVYGKIVRIYPQPGEDPDPVCDECDEEDDRHGRKIIGMEIIRNMVAGDENVYEQGEILDPEVGRIYRCRIWIEEGALMVRGYWGPLFRTQTWKRVD